jgi:hypothetical protein
MYTDSSKSIGDCTREGRDAFRKHGVTGETRHRYPEGSVLRDGFLSGFSHESFAASERALADSSDYHRLSVRDNAIDRAWAERLLAVGSN